MIKESIGFRVMTALNDNLRRARGSRRRMKPLVSVVLEWKKRVWVEEKEAEDEEGITSFTLQ